MIYVTGDTHGELARFSEENAICKCLQPDDMLIVAGDFGFIWGDYRDEIKLDLLESLPFTIAFHGFNQVSQVDIGRSFNHVMDVVFVCFHVRDHHLMFGTNFS